MEQNPVDELFDNLERELEAGNSQSQGAARRQIERHQLTLLDSIARSLVKLAEPLQFINHFEPPVGGDA